MIARFMFFYKPGVTDRTRAEPSEGVRTPPAKVEAQEDESLISHLVECAKVTHEWVEVSLLPRT